MIKKTNQMVPKAGGDKKNSVVYEPAPGTPPADVIATSVYVNKAALPANTTPATITLTMEIN